MNFPIWPHYGEDEIEAVSEVLRSGKVNNWTGKDVSAFEDALKTFSGQQHAIAVGNGTVALNLALLALGVGSGDEVICTSRSFLASASCTFRVGAIPVFADVHKDSQNVTAETIEQCITPRTKAVIVVHLAGWPCELTEIQALCDSKGIHLIEDCAQAHGGFYKDQPTGSFGKISTWSFCQDKIISTGGEGGCITTNDEALHEFLWSSKEHGKSLAKVRQRASVAQTPGYKWMHDSVGTNARLSGIQCAIGLLQLGKLEAMHAQRKSNAHFLWSACSDISGLRVPELPSHIEHAYYLGCVFVEPDKLKAGWSRDRILGEIQERNIYATVGSCPELYREKVFHDYHDQSIRHPVAKLLGETCIAFHVHPRLQEQHMAYICSAIADTLSKAVR